MLKTEKLKQTEKKLAKNQLSIRMLALACVIIVVILDQVSKALVTTYLSFSQHITVFPGFDLILRHNTGAAFSFLAGSGGWQRWFFILIALVIISGIVFWLFKLKNEEKREGFALALILGGAIGNFWDRLVHGYVIDFILWYYQDLPPWPAFNIADTAICVGVFIIALDIVRHKKST